MKRRDKIALIWREASQDPGTLDGLFTPEERGRLPSSGGQAPGSLTGLFTPEERGVSTRKGFEHKILYGGEVLKKGAQDSSTNGLVTKVQTLLEKLGYTLPGSGIDGVFGGETEKAVLEFQRNNKESGLIESGEVDGTTLLVLQGTTAKRRSKSGGAYTRKSPAGKVLPVEGGVLRKGNRGEAVKSLQANLLEKGYHLSATKSGSASGVFDKGTENAVLYFQVLNEIHPPNGIVDSRVLDKINSGSFIGPDNTKEPYPDAEKLEYTEKDVEAVARGLVVETGFRSNYREMANIIWIMINRSKKWNMPLYKIIDPDTGGGKNWYGRLSESNRKRWAKAHTRKDFGYIKQFVKQVLDGASFQNEIGNKAHFLHPGGMPKCDGEPGSPCGKNRVCVDTGKWGKRCLPKWNIDGNKNMAGKVNVQTIGRARFS